MMGRDFRKLPEAGQESRGIAGSAPFAVVGNFCQQRSACRRTARGNDRLWISQVFLLSKSGYSYRRQPFRLLDISLECGNVKAIRQFGSLGSGTLTLSDGYQLNVEVVHRSPKRPCAEAR